MSHRYTTSQRCDYCGMSQQTLLNLKRSRRVRIMRGYRWNDWTFIVGPWSARLVLSRHGSFGWYEGQNALIRFVRRWWTGWHDWTEECVW